VILKSATQSIMHTVSMYSPLRVQREKYLCSALANKNISLPTSWAYALPSEAADETRLVMREEHI